MAAQTRDGEEEEHRRTTRMNLARCPASIARRSSQSIGSVPMPTQYMSSLTPGTVASSSCRCLQEPLNYTPMGVNSISSDHLHVRPTGRTCRWSDETKKICPPERDYRSFS